MELEYTKTINSAQLMDELLALNLIEKKQPNGTSTVQGDVVYVSDDTPQTAIEQINQVVTAHVTKPEEPDIMS